MKTTVPDRTKQEARIPPAPIFEVFENAHRDAPMYPLPSSPSPVSLGDYLYYSNLYSLYYTSRYSQEHPLCYF